MAKRRHHNDVRRAPSTRFGRRWTIGIVVAVVLTGFVAARYAKRLMPGAEVPEPPILSNAPPALANHLQMKYAAARGDPTSPAVVGALCLAYHADLMYEQAERCYEQVAALDASEWRWIYRRALLQSERGGGEALAASLRQVLARESAFGPAWLRLGDAEFKAARYDRAEDAWSHAAAASDSLPSTEAPIHKRAIPLDAYASLGLARIALARGDEDHARQILERVTASTARFGPAFRLLAESYAAMGLPQDAARAMQRADRLPPYAPYADPIVDELARESRNSTFLLRQASEADLAVNADWIEFLTRRALMFDPENPDVLSKLGRLLRTLGRSGEALEYLRTYTRMVPADFQAVGLVGSCLSDLGRFEEAEPFIRRAVTEVDDALAHYNLGALLSATGRFDEAAVEYSRALDRDPSDPDARSNFAAVLMRQGKLPQASRELAQVLEIDPENANAHTNYGLLLAQQGHASEAAREFQTALRINPGQRQAAEGLRVLGR